MGRARKHPSLASYNRGCRCTECTDLNRRRIAAYRATPVSAKDLTHGTWSSYVAGCRCHLCSAEAKRRNHVYRYGVYEGLMPDKDLCTHNALQRCKARYAENVYVCGNCSKLFVVRDRVEPVVRPEPFSDGRQPWGSRPRQA